MVLKIKNKKFPPKAGLPLAEKVKSEKLKVSAKSLKVKKKTTNSKTRITTPTEKKAIVSSPKESAPTSLKTPLKHPAKEPTSMEELMAATGYRFQGLKKGQIVTGMITEIGKKQMLIDIGAKTEGVVANKEYELVRDYVSGLKVGDQIEAYVGSPENEKGQILLSLRRAASEFKWKLFQDLLTSGKAIEVRGLETNRGGVIARYHDIRGFVPASQFGREWLGRLKQLQNRVFQVKVIEVDREKNRLIFSEKLVSEEVALKSQKQAIKLVQVGAEYSGTVSGIMPFGVFVRVDVEKDAAASGLFLEGLVHISEVSWQKVGDLNKLFTVGQKIQVKILSINDKTSKLNLSIKKLQPDPWQNLVKKYQKDTKVTGQVSKLAAFGAFVTLEDGVEGLLHISKIPAEFGIKVGDKIEVYIESVDGEKKKISLGLVLKTKPVGYK